MTLIETDRLVLRSWQERDRPAFARLNSDPDVMRYFPATFTQAESDAMLDRIQDNARVNGFCFAPVEAKTNGAVLGFVGLNRPAYRPPLPIEPCVEIGWRLLPEAWGKGYATEAARAWLRFGFETLGLSEIVSFTAAVNHPSQKVMQRLGMSYRPEDDFDHPSVEPGHELRPHVLSRLSRNQWRRTI